MNMQASIFGFRKIVFASAIAAMMAGSFNAKGASPSSFEIWQVVEEKDSARAEELPVAHARPGGESSLRVMNQAVLNAADVVRAVAQKNGVNGENEVLVTLTEKA